MNKAQALKYISNLAILSALILALGISILKFSGNETSLGHLYFLVSLFTATAILFHFGFLWLFGKYPKRFVPVFMLLTIVKLLLYISVVIIYVFKMEEGIKQFLIIFLGMYISFLIFEVLQLLSFLKIKQSEGINNK